MIYDKFNLKNSVRIRKNESKGIASFNPKYDKIDNTNIMLDIPKKEIILDQSIYNSCVGHSLVMCASLLHYRKTNKWINFDPYVVYGTKYNGQWEGEGMYPDEAIDNCINDGFFLKRDFGKEAERPEIFDIVTSFKEDNPDLVTNAKNYNFSGKAWIDNSNEAKAALKLGMPISATWMLYDSFFSDTDSSGLVHCPDIENETYLGNHQMTIIGTRNDDTYVVVNSYGENYGFKGMYFIPFNYNWIQAYAISDTIMPAKYKAEKIVLKINDPNIIIDDEIVVSDMNPIVLDDRTMIPIRLISEALGASVEWIGETLTVIIRSEEAEIVLTIGNTHYTIDGVDKEMDTEPMVLNDRTLVPIRFISEALNCEVEWDQDNLEVTIKCL